MKRTRVAACLFLSCLLGGITQAEESRAEDRKAQATFALRDADGVVRRLADQRGKWVVLEWVNFECAPVKALYQAPTRKMQALQRAWRAKGVVWFSINSAPQGQRGHLDAKRAKATLASLGAAPSALLLDPTRAAATAFGVQVTPEVRVISPRGDVVYAGSVESFGKGPRVQHLQEVLNAGTRGQAIPYAMKPVQGCRIAATTAAPANSGPKAPDFTLVDTKGRRHRLSDYRGKWVILEWINVDCPFVKEQYHPSKRTMQLLQTRARRLGMVWLSICSSAPGKEGHHSSAQVDARLKRMGAVPAAYLHDPAGVAGRSYGARKTPEMRIISPQGTIEYAGGVVNIEQARGSRGGTKRNYVRLAIADIVARRPIAAKKSQPFGCSVKY